jgi:hypothetical protein
MPAAFLLGQVPARGLAGEPGARPAPGPGYPRAEDQKVELSTGLGTIMAVLEPLLSETPVTVSMHGVFFAGVFRTPPFAAASDRPC